MSGLIPEGKIAEIRNASNLVEIISDFVALKKTGNNFLGLCPFHAEKTPSFTVSSDKQIFHCFGCGEGGDVFTFLMRHKKISFLETLRLLGDKYGIALPRQTLTPAQKQALEEKERILECNKIAARYFKEVLRRHGLGKRAQEYLQKRKMGSQVIERFDLGYAPVGWRGLLNHIESNGRTTEYFEKAGLIAAKNDKKYDRFRDRVIFPIRDVGGQIVGFGGRCLDDSTPKYLNSPESPVYHKGRVLYGLHEAKDACRREGYALVVEGYFDVLALHCHGIENVVAPLGTALTQDHVRSIKGYAQEAILVFDSDTAGVKAATRSLPMFAEEKIDTRVLILPQGHDPDTYIFEAGADEFKRQARNAFPVMRFIMESSIRAHGLSSEGKAKIVADLKIPLVSMPDAIIRSAYVKELSERLNVSEESILEQLRITSRGITLRKQDEIQTSADKLDKAMLRIMLFYPDMLGGAQGREIVNGFESSCIKKAGELVLTNIEQGKPTSEADLVAQAINEETRKLFTSILMEEGPLDRANCESILYQHLTRLRKREEESLSQRIKEAEKMNNQEMLHQLLAEKQQRAMQRFNKERVCN